MFIHTQSYDEGLSNWTTVCFESQAFGYNIENRALTGKKYV